MTKTKSTTITINLPRHMQRNLEHLSQTNKMSIEQVILNGLNLYIKNLENAAFHKIESHFVRALEEQTSRIAAILAKVAIDNRTTLRVLARDCSTDFLQFSRSEAMNAIMPALTESELAHFEQLSPRPAQAGDEPNSSQT